MLACVFLLYAIISIALVVLYAIYFNPEDPIDFLILIVLWPIMFIRILYISIRKKISK